MFPHFSSFESIFGVHWGILRADLSLLRAHFVTPARRFVTPARRFVTPARRFVTYRPRDGKFTARGTACLPPEGRHVYRPTGGK